MSLRDLFIGVDFDVNEKELRKGDDAVNDLTKETKKAGSEMKTLDKNSKKAGSSIGSMAKKIGAIVGIYEIGRGLKYAVGQAAALEEQTAKFNTVFGQFSGQANEWAEEYAKKVGRSAIETKGAIAENQNLLVGFGATRKVALGMSTDIQSLAVDLASFNDIQDETASNNIRSVLLGQHQAGKSLGLAITENTLSQLALSEGYKKSFRELDPLTKMQLRYQLMVQQSGDTMGDAERTAGSYTNQMKRLEGGIKDIAAKAGMTFLPMLTTMVTSINENKESIAGFVIGAVDVLSVSFQAVGKAGGFLIDTFNTFEPIIYGLAAAFTVQKIAMVGAGVISGLTTAYSALASMQVVLGTNTMAGTAIQWAWNVALNANPLGMIALAIGVVVAGVKLMYDNFEWFRQLWDNTIGAIWDKVKLFVGMSGKKTQIDINETTTANKNTNVAGTVSTSSVPKYANGTNNAKAGLSIVGENGIEAVSMNGGEKVFNNKETKNMLGGNSQTNNISVNVTVNGDSNGKQVATNVVDEIDNYFRRMKLKGGYA